MKYKDTCVIRKEVYEKFCETQRTDVLKNFSLDEKGNIVIPFRHKGYSCNNRRWHFSQNIKAISMFSGAGGLDIGCQLAGVKVISSLDIYVDSVETLRSNNCFKHTQHDVGDITKISGQQYSALLRKENPQKLIVIGGPPCQPFSKAGYWVTNKNRNPDDDPRNLIRPYFRILEELQPDGFVLENVESILHPSNKCAIETIYAQMTRLGYHCSMIRTNAVDYGIPQKRKRVFFLASKKNINAVLKKTHGSEEECRNDISLKPYERAIDWIGMYENTFDTGSEVLDISGKWEKELMCVPFGRNYIALSEKAGYPTPVFVAGKRYWSSLLKLHPLFPSWTVIASPGHWEGPFHWNNRRLSTRELAALQTFPDDYIFCGSQISRHKQIGNAVPPLLAKIVVEELCRWL